jgi:hypothetical protein
MKKNVTRRTRVENKMSRLAVNFRVYPNAVFSGAAVRDLHTATNTEKDTFHLKRTLINLVQVPNQTPHVGLGVEG